MIGKDQAKGYGPIKPEVRSEEEESETKEKEDFEERKTKALRLMGVGAEFQEPHSENPEEIAKKALENMGDHKKKVIDHDIMILRQQNQSIIKSLNELTEAVRDLIKKGEK